MLKKIVIYLFIFSAYFYNNLFSLKKIHNPAVTYCQRWNWMSICDFAYANNHDGGEKEFKNTTPFDPNDVFPGSVIFATGHSIDDFFKKVHPKIKHPYILLTLFCGIKLEYIEDPKIIAWFGNNDFYNGKPNKFEYIPLGLFRDEHLFYQKDKMHEYFLTLRKKPKKHLLYMNFCLHSWSLERKKIFELFHNKNFVHTTNSRKPFLEYMDEMANYKFVLSPPGDQFDCYRHWEALMVGCIPIVRKSHLDILFEDLPVVIINDWSEVTEDFLQKKYREIANTKYDLKKLYVQYWADKIDEVKNKYLNSH